MTKEFIVCSAIKIEGTSPQLDDVYWGHRHFNCFAAMAKRRDLLVLDDSARVLMLQNQTQGFMTSLNRFVGRKEAMQIARKQGQIIKEYGDGKILYSECLY